MTYMRIREATLPKKQTSVHTYDICAHLDVASGALADDVLAGDGLPGHVYPSAGGLEVVRLGVDLSDGLRDGAILHGAHR